MKRLCRYSLYLGVIFWVFFTYRHVISCDLEGMRWKQKLWCDVATYYSSFIILIIPVLLGLVGVKHAKVWERILYIVLVVAPFGYFSFFVYLAISNYGLTLKIS